MPTPAPPQAPRRPTTLTAHEDERVDEWYWLREKDSPEVIAHLEAENAFTEALTAHTAKLQETLFEEIRSHVVETDLSVPTLRDGWWYYSRTIEGKAYSVSCRVAATSDDRTPPALDATTAVPGEQVLLDSNVEAEGHDYFALGVFDVSPDSQLLAWAVDLTGGEVFTLRFRDLRTGADLPDVVEGLQYGSAWASDNATFFYTRPDSAMRPYQVWRHTLGTPATDDVLVFQEDDESFFLGIDRTKDGQMLLLGLGSKVTSECHYLRADDPTGSFTVIEPRRQGIEYDVDHQGSRFLIVTNDEAESFKLVSAPDDSPGAGSWTEVVPYDPDVRLLGIDVSRDHVALQERAGGLTRVRLLELASGALHVIEQPEAAYTLGLSGTPDYDSPLIRYTYTSLVTPASVYDYDVARREPVLRKRQPVPAYDASLYVSDRTWAPAPDGTLVPVTLVARKDRGRDSGPCLLYGYGSYEASMDPSFLGSRLSLLDRGFVFAIAHVRGGGEMGRQWYEQGKLAAKPNTFSDFTACAEHLIAEGWTTAGRIVARGGSAGGLLMGAIVNARPDLYAGIVAQVPFVDALTTILDPSLPLTVMEWEEWGNPVESKEIYEVMRSYAPYDNVVTQPYPPILATAGLNDPRVSYWEPAKWVQRLREHTTSEAPILLKTEMGAGHGGPSGRYDAWHEEAFALAFALDCVGQA
ncbi:MAG: protease [Frankiales bacterium]|nr:protease [Frankiales bacterium]